METFKSKKHKKKVNHLILFTTDAVDSRVREIRLTPWVFRFLTVTLCLIIGVVVGCAVYGVSMYQEFFNTNSGQRETIATLKEEKQELEAENAELTEMVAILSETVNQKVQAEKEQQALDEEMKLPKEFPLTGSAQVTETDTVQALADILREEVGAVIQRHGDDEEESQPICIFKATEGTTAVAAGHGSVTQVTEDLNYGYRIVIDHGNGYKTIYLNQGDPKVKEGDSIKRGDTLFVIGSDNTTLGYQMLKDEAYINPMDMIAISG